MGIYMDYYSKYLKYKNKHLVAKQEMLNNQVGGGFLEDLNKIPEEEKNQNPLEFMNRLTSSDDEGPESPPENFRSNPPHAPKGVPHNTQHFFPEDEQNERRPDEINIPEEERNRDVPVAPRPEDEEEEGRFNFGTRPRRPTQINIPEGNRDGPEAPNAPRPEDDEDRFFPDNNRRPTQINIPQGNRDGPEAPNAP